MMIKKSLAILLMLFMVLASLTGCSSSSKKTTAKQNSSTKINKTGFPIVNKKISITMFAPTVGVIEWDKMKYFQTMEKKTNIHFNFKTVPDSSLDTKKNLTFASGDLPDVFYAASLTRQEQVKYGKQGILIPLEDLIKKYAPNIEKMLDEHPDVRKAITAPDGHIYALPYYSNGNPWDGSPMWYNGKWLKALGIKTLPTTTDGLFNLLEKFKNDDPNGNGKKDEIPLSGWNEDLMRNYFMSAFGIRSQGVEVSDGKVNYGAIQPGYKDYLAYMHKLWANGLLDHQKFSQTQDQMKANGQTNKIGLFENWFAYFVLGGQPSTSDPMMAPIKAPNVSEPTIPITDNITPGEFAITSKDPYPEATIRWIDYSYSPEGDTLLNIGPEGTFWKWQDKSKGIRVQKPVPSQFKSSEDWRGTLTPAYGIPVPQWQTDIKWNTKNVFGDWTVSETKKKILPYGQVPIPALFLTAEQADQVSQINSDLDTYVQQEEAKFITGQEPLSNWDKYVKTIKSMNVDQLVGIYQTAYQQYEKN